jgi:hypothetical protein
MTFRLERKLANAILAAVPFCSLELNPPRKIERCLVKIQTKALGEAFLGASNVHSSNFNLLVTQR